MTRKRVVEVDLSGGSSGSLNEQFRQGLRFLTLAIQNATELSEPFRSLDPGYDLVPLYDIPYRLLDWGMEARMKLKDYRLAIHYGFDGSADWVRLLIPMTWGIVRAKRFCDIHFVIAATEPMSAMLYVKGIPADLQTMNFWTTWYPTFSGGSRVGHGPSMTLQKAIDGSEDQREDE